MVLRVSWDTEEFSLFECFLEFFKVLSVFSIVF